MLRLKEKWFNFYYAAEGGPFDSCSVRNMVILVAAALVAYA